MNVGVIKQTILQKINKKKTVDDCPDQDYLVYKSQVENYEKATTRYTKILKTWARKSETASKNQHEMGEIIMEAADGETDSRTKELLSRMGDCLLTLSDVQHSMLIRSVESIIFPFQQFQTEAKELTIFHKYWLKTLAVYKAQLETYHKAQKLGGEKSELQLQELTQRATEMDDALHDARERAYKLKKELDADNSMILMFDMLHNYFKAGLEYTQEVMPVVEEYKKTIQERAKEIKITKITTPVDSPTPRNDVPEFESTPTVNTTNTKPLSDTPKSILKGSSLPTHSSLSSKQSNGKSQVLNNSAPKSALRSVAPPPPPQRSSEPAPIGTAFAAYSYSARDDSEISFEEGESIIIFEQEDSDWGKGRTKNSSKIGDFPWNYVTKFKKLEKVIAEYDFNAQDGDEISFKEGDTISLLIEEGDWWYGELNGKFGIFPQNYVRKK